MGLETSKQAQQRLSTKQNETKELKEAAYSQPGAFKAKFERAFGTAYNYENIENLKKKSVVWAYLPNNKIGLLSDSRMLLILKVFSLI